jgi:phosphoribosylformimino-5-aminoimidazole carboxamide ribotide isomerase
MNVIPAIDIQRGETVRLFQGQFDQVTTYGLTPVELAERYARLRAPWVHCVDLDGARQGSAGNDETVGEIAAVLRGRVQVGGGVATRAVAGDLLGRGVGRVVVGSLAVEDPDEVATWLGDLGPDRVVLALDVRRTEGDPVVMYRGWTAASDLSLWNALDSWSQRGLRHVLCTDVERDGAMEGPAVDLYRDMAARYPDLEIQSSGGVRAVDDLDALAAAGAASAVVGRALLEGSISDKELEPFLPNA